ncbi:HVSL domain-containing protein [Rhodotorula paludigena]|uniref:HVSL domain-containing protein n=1 Tax=Rhodotorula paludigena TaxID=86838 RepID=UPI003171720A
MAAEPPKKKRKLPPLDDSFEATPRRSDSPELHQGRKRSVPHQQGQWAAHVYLELDPSSALRRVLKQATADASALAPSSAAVHSLLEPAKGSAANFPSRLATPVSDAGSELASTPASSLHVSLSRPLMLQTNQREELGRAVARLAGRITGFAARYASFGVLENDDKTRRFLGVEIGQGYDQLYALVRQLDEALQPQRLPAYYDSPRFHTSLAWTSATSASSSPPLPFDNISVEELEQRFGKKLRAEGEVWVGELCVKIGKDVQRYRLSGC